MTTQAPDRLNGPGRPDGDDALELLLPAAGEGGRRRRWQLRSRLALGLSPAPRFGLLLLPLGLGLGPEGLGLLSPRVLSMIDPALPVAGATIGLLAGLGFDLRRRGDARLLAAASQQALLTAVLVAAGVLALQRIDMVEPFHWSMAVLLGICAASSASPGDRAPSRAVSSALRVVELDDVLPIAAGGVALAFVQYAGAGAALAAIAQLALIALLFGGACWVLVAQTASEIEQRVFVFGTLLLLGGGAAYLSLSELFAGFAAGMLWNRVAGATREPLEASVQGFQHPLVALLLLVAGARCRVSGAALALAGIYLVCRTAGKLSGGRIAARIARVPGAADIGLDLVSPGVVAVAFALNALQVGPPAVMETLLSAVVLGSLGSELLAWMTLPRVAE